MQRRWEAGGGDGARPPRLQSPRNRLESRILETLFETQLAAFLECGGWIALPATGGGVSNDLWVGWGRVTRLALEESQTLERPAFYAPDFFLEDPRPLWVFESGMRISKANFLNLLERAQSSFQKSALTPNPGSGSAQVDPRFAEVFHDLKQKISQGELRKGVPYIFHRVELGQKAGDRLQLLLQLLRNTSVAPLSVYGVWDQSEGILGATPEALFTQNQSQYETMALAGTQVRGAQTGSILNDPKEREEHQIVVEGIVKSLENEFGENLLRLEVGDLGLLELPNLTHLRTLIQFQLRPEPGQFGRLVRALHPTPALGAFPKSTGLSWLAEVEKKIPRRRFGAPFGLLSAQSPLDPADGAGLDSFCLVAIRNLQWDSAGAWIGAGCGVVQASQLEREWNEIQGKLRSVRKLFGWEKSSKAMGPNLTLAMESLEKLYQWGVREVCVCPGARNAPWVALLSENPELFQTYYHFEERSAAFFALGRIRATGRPMAVITTSGTAAGELLPAVMEAYYSGLPLILMTADRPRHYRGSGAPQTAEQVGLFGVYASIHFDLESGDSSRPEMWREMLQAELTQPVHLNCCFDEPLIDGDVPKLQFTDIAEKAVNRQLPLLGDTTEFFKKVKHPLVLVGMLHPSEQESVAKALLKLNCPVYLEATSGLREKPELQHLRIQLADGMRDRIKKAGVPLDGVIRMGGIPTPRLWRDLESVLCDLPVLSLSSLPFSGLGRKSQLAVGPLSDLMTSVTQTLDHLHWDSQESDFTPFLDLDHKAAAQLREAVNAEPQSQLGMIARLSDLIPNHSKIYLGNSMPIRDWDLTASSEDRHHQVWASRGLNGIDGQVSTFIGWAGGTPTDAHSAQNWAILGDLTSLYDLAGPWILSQLQSTRVNLVVVNNGGGKIFSGMFQQKEFQNQHSVQFRSWAELWGLDYELWTQTPDCLPGSPAKSRIIEIRPCSQAAKRLAELRVKSGLN